MNYQEMAAKNKHSPRDRKKRFWGTQKQLKAGCAGTTSISYHSPKTMTETLREKLDNNKSDILRISTVASTEEKRFLV